MWSNRIDQFHGRILESIQEYLYLGHWESLCHHIIKNALRVRLVYLHIQEVAVTQKLVREDFGVESQRKGKATKSDLYSQYRRS